VKINVKQSRKDDWTIAAWCEGSPTKPSENTHEIREFWYWSAIRGWQPRYFSNNALAVRRVFALIKSRGLTELLGVPSFLTIPLDQQIVAILQMIEKEGHESANS